MFNTLSQEQGDKVIREDIKDLNRRSKTSRGYSFQVHMKLLSKKKKKNGYMLGHEARINMFQRTNIAGKVLGRSASKARIQQRK